MTRGCNGDGITKAVENATSPQSSSKQAEEGHQILAIYAEKTLLDCAAPLQSTRSLGTTCDKLYISVDVNRKIPGDESEVLAVLAVLSLLC
jgi:hypothetical protein